MRAFIVAAAVAISAMSSIPVSVSDAAEIKVISSNGMREVIADTKAQFEATTGHRLTVNVVETGEIRRRVLAGEAVDVILVPKETAEEVEMRGKLVPGSGVP